MRRRGRGLERSGHGKLRLLLARMTDLPHVHLSQSFSKKCVGRLNAGGRIQQTRKTDELPALSDSWTCTRNESEPAAPNGFRKCIHMSYVWGVLIGFGTSRPRVNLVYLFAQTRPKHGMSITLRLANIPTLHGVKQKQKRDQRILIRARLRFKLRLALACLLGSESEGSADNIMMTIDHDGDLVVLVGRGQDTGPFKGVKAPRYINASTSTCYVSIATLGGVSKILSGVRCHYPKVSIPFNVVQIRYKGNAAMPRPRRQLQIKPKDQKLTRSAVDRSLKKVTIVPTFYHDQAPSGRWISICLGALGGGY
ncbi:hypothetical protein BU15DRAFT_63742 [Melanogaster broomeanus]|nr:hypothetical protein BU15DRAFT_63742 [Melanogaster broomeanus]